MNDTKRRIKAYKAALPGLRERVTAVALLLCMSLAMMTSATFAWLTISRRPEVSGVNTTVAANGSLEIALASGDGTIAPGESKVGDSSAAQGQTVVASNLTWGNLVNLSDESYGLDNLTLRPAQLNTASLLKSPLYGAVYGQDGRITQLTSNFGYTRWNLPEGDKPGYFGVSDEYGVRAISSTKIEAVGADALYVKMVEAAKDTNAIAANMYRSLGDNDKYMPSLATMMGLYMTARMNPDNATLSNPTCDVADIQNLRDMYGEFLNAFDKEAEAIAALLNLQLFLKYGEGAYTPYTKDMVYASSEAALKNEGLQITALNQFIKDRNTIVSDHAKLVAICESGTSLAWKDSGLNDIVNNLVNVGACTIGADNTPISSIGASNALGYLSGTQEARITNGILYRFEERTGGYIEVKNLGISATVERGGFTIPATVRANIQTTAPRDYTYFNNDLVYTESQNTGDFKGGVAVAEDTYGLAVDLWVRTNSEGSYLTLEGNILTDTKEINPTGKNADNEDVYLYTLTVTGTDENSESVSYTIDVYSGTDENGDTVWYDASTHMALTEEQLNGNTPVQKVEEVEYVIGYEGENRVWTGKGLSVDATTQGSGSCYVYYADTPEDQARSLILLEAFNVAFVDEDGKLMATAIMDTERYHAENGRVIVPLVLSTSDSLNLGEDYEGNITYAITPLEKNVPTRVTAIVYLDGTKLSNDEVLAAADIQGQLNIQFGSSEVMTPIDNEELENKERRVSASVDNAYFNFDEYTGDMITNVTINVDGDEPSTVTAFFIRAINDSQGSREEVMTFTKNDSGNWVSSFKFAVPGIYKLRTVQLDGIDYTLENPPTVTIEGFAIDALTCAEADENRHVNVLTAANSSTVNLSLKFATDDITKMPSTVQGRFLREEDGSAVNVNFTYNSGVWIGTATFLASGEYTIQYLLLNGEYMELAEEFRQTADVTLGMRVKVYTTSPRTFKYLGSNMADNEKMLGMQVMIVDNEGNEMPGMSGAKLTYKMKGSGIRTMDTDLTWNGSYYVGEMQNAGPGVWEFSNVTVGGNVLTNATEYPTFTIQSPEPPAYYGHDTTTYQYAPGNNAVMRVQITNSSAAVGSVQALIVKSDGTEEWVNGDIGGEFTAADGTTSVNHWSFQVPGDANGYQDGNWTLTKIKMWNVFAADGTAYTEESPLILELPADANNKTKVVCRVYVSFAEDKGQNLGKDAAGNVTAAFMTSHTISGLNVDIRDFEGQKVDGVADVQLKFTYVNGSSVANGGYSSTSLNNATAGATITVPLTADSTGAHFVQGDDVTIRYAGNYTTEFSFTLKGQTTTYGGTSGNALPGNAPVFTVWSKTPYVKFTATNPAVGTTFTGANEAADATVDRQNVISNNGYSVEVFYQASGNSGCGGGCTGYTASKATLGLFDAGINFTSATCTITSKGNGSDVVYTFKPGTTETTLYNEQSLGSASGTTRNGIGSGAQATELIFTTSDGTTYTFKLANVISATAQY